MVLELVDLRSERAKVFFKEQRFESTCWHALGREVEPDHQDVVATVFEERRGDAVLFRFEKVFREADRADAKLAGEVFEPIRPRVSKAAAVDSLLEEGGGLLVEPAERMARRFSAPFGFAVAIGEDRDGKAAVPHREILR